jgi:hypothetical protein
MSSKSIFGGAIAVLLLGLFAYLVVSAVSAARGDAGAFNDQMGRSMLMISGLVSALVIAVLAITPPAEAPAVAALAADASPNTQSAVKVVSWLYVAAWAACGVAALVTGWRHPDAVKSLTDLGDAWLGLAVAAGYAYFGINPQSRLGE